MTPDRSRTGHERISRRTYIAAGAASLIAGCTGGGDGGGDGGTDDGGADGDGGTDDGGADGDGTDPSGDGTSDGEVGPEYTHFVFEEGERYEYDVTAGSVDGTLVWEVTDVSGDQVTVHITGELGTPFDETVTGTRDTIRQKIADTQFGELVTSGLLTPFESILQGHTLEEGNSWSGTTPGGSGQVSITGTDSYAGIDCYVAEVQVNGVVRYTACLSPRLGLAVHSTVTPDGTTVAQEFELTAYSSG